MTPHNPSSDSNRLRERDAHVRRAKHLTAWTAAGGLVVTGGLATLAERSFSGQRRTVAPAETSVIDPSLDTTVGPAATNATALTLPPDPASTVPVVLVPVTAPAIAPAQTLPPVAATVPVETMPPTTAAPAPTVPVTAPPAPPTTQPKRRTHTHTHPAVVVTSGGS